MYNGRNKSRIILVLGILILCGCQSQTFGFDLADEISASFQRAYNGGYSDDYMNTPYTSVYPKDPFGEALKDEEDMSNQQKIAGIEYIENELSALNCSLSQKKLWAILYYFVPEFRADIARNLKKDLGDSSSKKFILDEDEVMDYCKDYFQCIRGELKEKADSTLEKKLDEACGEKEKDYNNCVNSCSINWNNCKKECNTLYKLFSDGLQKCNNNCNVEQAKCNKDYSKKDCKPLKEEYDECVKQNKKEIKASTDYLEISESTPANIKSNCQEFFVINYQKGEEAEKRVQDVQTSQLGSDKYWNATTDDSPYDIMIDFGTIGKLLYQEAEQPITPVIYNLPIFSKSQKALDRHKTLGSSYESTRSTRNNGNNQNSGVGGGNTPSSEGGSNGGGGDSSNPIPLPLPKRGEGFSMEGGYDDLIDGLGVYTMEKDNSIYYGNECVDQQQTPEPEGESGESDKGLRIKNAQKIGRDVSNLSDKELNVLMDYMVDAVDKYSTLPDDKKKNIQEQAGDTSRFNDDTEPSELEKTAEEIKNCWKGCKGLRIDQKASCMLMCSCGEIKSPIFNPEKTPGLGPIFMMRFCTVPATDTRFIVGGKRIISIEEGMKEIYGVVDKLSREGRLGIWTQQYNYLDSTTKKMKVADTVAFTIDVEIVDISNNNPTRSKQYEEKQIAVSNEIRQTAYGISNKIDNPSLKNKYRLIGGEGEYVNDLMIKGNDEKVRNTLNDLNQGPTVLADPNTDSHSSRYNDMAQQLNRLLDQQGNYWEETLGYINEFDSSANALYSKKKI